MIALASAISLREPFLLPNGAVIPNRIAKAATEENLATRDCLPSDALIALYRRWAAGGAGLLLSGNVMVDARAMTGPADVVLDADQPLAPFRAWAQAMRGGGGQAWLQLCHPGRQVFASLGEPTVAPSAVPLALGRFSKLFAMPRALELAEIDDLVQRFATAAARAEEACFTGVQVHAAHGYLVSQFLSPLANRRADRWGGTPENRARFLLDIVRAIRLAVSPGFCVAVKLNSTDFQRGGFDPDHAADVVRRLNALSVDLVELSGGSYESPTAVEAAKAESTLRREAFFLDFARAIATDARMPLMVTGGIRERRVAQEVLRTTADGRGVAMVGMATALVFAPDLPTRWLAGADAEVQVPVARWRSPEWAAIGNAALAKCQIIRLSRGKRARGTIPPILAVLADWRRTRRDAHRYVQWRQRRRVIGPTGSSEIEGSAVPIPIHRT